MTKIKTECEICGRMTNLTIHHKVPKSEGGSLMPDNIQVLCKDCHRKVHSTKHSRNVWKIRIVRYEKGKESEELFENVGDELDGSSL